ncbi:four-carbon acid sugar kinase family protein [Rhizobium sp. AAP43]|uniref:four-carbon acid sugar kinase family protein n=1 Tax=Rhizobium sp. AAP43 TaxID=1523420 RepID=UPI0006B939CF|nr:four-carbon acid sugar kinase family protein [Rhizobium sp. AAP43]KPF41288.1 Hrp-dependent type III effector protein [Rhizobium sp. AAP43]
MLAIIADDLTGALDTGAPFAGRGLRTEVALNVAAIAGAVAEEPEVLTINLGSRELDAVSAGALASQAIGALPAGTRVFKKVDSRLKGHVAAELDPIPYRAALVAPAIPEFGRVVRAGHVAGFGVEQPINVASRLGDHAERCSIPDIASADEMRLALQIADSEGVDLLVGARGLAEALAEQMSERHDPDLAELPKGRAVFVIGSRDPITLVQIASLRDAEPDIDHRAAPNGVVPDEPAGDRPLVLIQATVGAEDVSSLQVSTNLASGVHPVLTASATTLLLCGGATAEAVLSEMGITRFRLLGECLPGLGLAYAGGQCIIAKSGGFGTPDTLVTLAARLQGDMG